MKTNKIFIFLFIGLLSLSSCDNGFEEMNVDPNNPISVPADMFIPNITRRAMDNMYSTFVGGDMGVAWAQQISKVQYNDEERFYPRNSTINNFWDSMYASVIADADEMYTLAEAEGNNNLMGVALVLKAYGFSVLTDCYGMIPFTEALQAGSGNFKPVYDSQSTVYTGILAMLDDAAALLGTGGAISPTTDVIYGGDASKWEKFANSLKFRSLMRISAKADVSSQLQTLYDGGMMFTSNDDEAKLIYFSDVANANPLHVTIDDGGRGEWKACSTMVDLMNSKADARIDVYFGLNEDDEIRGKTPGIADVPSDEFNYANVSPVGDFYLRPEAPAFFMSYPELELLIAEAAVKNLVVGADADLHFSNGMIASFEANEALGGAIYASSQGSATLQKIAEEKYVALYWQGIEVWTEVRRTGFPILQPVEDANPDVVGPFRYYYNGDESSINGANYDAAVATQGADVLDTPVWWMP